METKFSKDDPAEKMDMAQEGVGLPPGIGSRALADLTKHVLAKVDTAVGDAVELLDEFYDRFKLMAAVAASVLNRFGNGPLEAVMPKDIWSEMPPNKRQHAIVDCINALTLEPNQLSQRERAVGIILQTCILAEYGPTKQPDKMMALVEELLKP